MKLFSKPGKKQKKISKRYPKGLFLIVICGVCITIAIIVASLFTSFWNNNGEADNQNEFHREAMPDTEPLPTETPDSTPTNSPTLEPSPEITPEPIDDGIRLPDRVIDFVELHNRNPDVIAWINVPGTSIDYPVVISRDNDDYLRRGFDGNHDTAGTIFIDMINRPDFSDRVTVMYGHNMRDGTMFADLHRFSDTEFFNDNRELKLYTHEGLHVYEIIAAYRTDDNNILYQTDYSDDDVWKSYITDIFNNTDPSANLFLKEIGENDKMLTLSTCIRNEDEMRFLVQGILKKGTD